jgi:Methyltransferase domain
VKGCCPPPGCEIFTERVARRDAARYRRKGLSKASRKLLALVLGKGEDVLEVGGGVGALQIELLRRGATRAFNVELSPAYEGEASSLLSEHGFEARVDRQLFDFAREGARVPHADIVLLNRVVCCYPDMPTLLGVAAEHTRRVLAMSYPPDRWPFRLAARAINLWCWFSRREFRFFVHSPAAMVDVAAARGLRLAERERTGIWELAAFERLVTEPAQS